MKKLIFGLLVTAAVAVFSYYAWAQTPLAGGTATGTGYPNNSLGVSATGTGTTGAVTATLAGSPGRTTFICGFVITNGPLTSATAGSATATITGTNATLNFIYVDVSSGQGLLGVAFPTCIPASGTNTAIVVTKPSSGATNITSAVSAWGYQL